MMESGSLIASQLLQINAIKLSPANPFTWASGWRSPIYCDNRKTLSYPAVRTLIRDEFVMRIRELYPGVKLIAGVATGAIAHGVLVAESLGLPFVYVRSAAKGHGLGNLIEGDFTPGDSTVIIEDLISTGGSSLAAFQALKQSGLEVLGMLAIFTYGFETASENFNQAGCQLHTLSDYKTLVELALKAGYIRIEEADLLNSWRESPQTWGV